MASSKATCQEGRTTILRVQLSGKQFFRASDLDDLYWPDPYYEHDGFFGRGSLEHRRLVLDNVSINMEVQACFVIVSISPISPISLSTLEPLRKGPPLGQHQRPERWERRRLC